MRLIRALLPTLFPALLLIPGGDLRAQATYGSLSGTVAHDGAPLPGVSVTLSSASLQGGRSAVTNRLGAYHFAALPPGEYVASFSMEGMQPVTKTVRVALASGQRLDVALNLMVVAEALTVTATDTEIVAPEGVQTNLPSKLIEELPIGRDVKGAIDLAPGVTTNEFGQTVVGGGYAYDSLYLINGGIANNTLTGQPESLFIEDAIQEITVLSGTISAEFGRFTGGVVSVITRSGGNEFSGSLRANISNPAWTARSDAGEPRRESILNETWEATLGGRVLRDRLWFFGAGRLVDETPARYYQYINEQYPYERTDERYEVKLTGQIDPRHSLVGSWTSWEVADDPNCSLGCWEPSTIDADGRAVPRDLLVGRYNGILSNNVLLEAGYSNTKLKFVDAGGEYETKDFSDARDIALGSWGYDYWYGGTWGSPAFCVPCGDEDVRRNEAWNLKGTYYLATSDLGTHNVVAGYENFANRRDSTLYWSGSSFGVYIYSGIMPTRAGAAGDPGTLRPVISYGDVIIYAPVENPSLGSSYVTDSIFVNDRWDLGSKWSFNIGARYDRSDGVDGRGQTISKDAAISPRIGATFDVRGDGRVRLNASFSRYVSHIQQLIGSAGDTGGPTYYLYWYDGPPIGGPDSGLDSFDVLEQTFAWLLAQGWTPETPTHPYSFFGADIVGFNRRLDGTLKSQHADEISFGVAFQLGQRGFVSADYLDKRWGDFYVSSTAPGDTVTGPPGTFDVVTIDNCSDCLNRTYKAVQVQAGYRFNDRLTTGGNYTWSQARGNTVGESGYATWDDVLQYPDYHDFPQNRPVGFLPTDRTHKARLWVSYDLPLGPFGNLSASLLERFDSGSPYSAVAQINTKSYVSCHPCGYVTPDTTHDYYFSDRGEYRWEAAASTDVALNYQLPIAGVRVFVQAELLNAFNEQAVVRGGTSIRTLAPFDPFTETPVEGVHWEKRDGFGETFAGYQAPRTYRFSLGIRF